MTTSSQLQKQKTINFNKQIQNYYLIFLSSDTSVVSNLSHSEYLNYHSLDNKLSATKQKGQSYYLILTNRYGIKYLPQFLPSGSFLSINIEAFWQPVALDNHKTATFWKLHLVKGFQCHSNQSQQVLWLEK